MALAGCSNFQNKPVQKETELLDNFMLEDTTAHEELFGAVDSNLNIKKIGVPDDDPGSTDIPRVGVQFSDSYKRDVLDGEGLPTGEKVDCIAVRYVAAIKGDLTTQNAVWTRGVSEVNSNQIKGMSGGHNSTEVYVSLNDGGSPTGVPSGYNNFVVYTMYDIPTSQSNSYIAAYLTLTPKAGGDSHQSAAVVTEIDGGHYFSVDMDDLVKDGYFLNIYNDTGLSPINVIAPQNSSADTNPGDDEKDNAMFSETTFVDGDKIGAFRLTPTIFQFYGFTAFMNSSASGYVKTTSVNEFAEFHVSGKYVTFLNKYNVVYFSPRNATGLTFKFVAWGDWDTANARLEMYCFNSYNDEEEWITLSSHDGHTYTITPDIWKYDMVIFCRSDKAQTAGLWSSVWNQSGDIGVGLDLTKSTFTLTQPSEWDGWTASWIAS